MNPDELLIADFLADRLEPDQKKLILARIEQDKGFAQDLRSRQMELTILRAHERTQLKARLKKEIASRAPVRNIRPLWIGLAVAAAVAAIILIFNPFSPKMTSQELAMSYLEPFPVQQVRGENTQGEPAILLYQSGQYSEAAEAFKILDSSNPGIVLMYASALMQVKEYKQALEVLEQVESSGRYTDVYLWNLALASVLDGQDDTARGLLEEISRSSHYKGKEAKELLERLLSSS